MQAAFVTTCLLFYDYLRDDKIPSFSFTLSSEQHSSNIRINHSRGDCSANYGSTSYRIFSNKS